MAVFSLVSQSLRTGEPMHQVLPASLLDRLFYHDVRTHLPAGPLENGRAVDVEAIKSVNYMYYASSIVAVYQILRVSSARALSNPPWTLVDGDTDAFFCGA